MWNKFLQFESEVGDLASIVKVEKRRAQVLGKVLLSDLTETPRGNYTINLCKMVSLVEFLHIVWPHIFHS